VLIDAPTLAKQSHELGQRILQLETEAYEIAGQPFNLSSPKQLGEIFFDKLGMPVVKKTATGARSTDEEVLEKLAEDYPLPAKLLEHRGLAKLKGTYTDKLAQLALPRTGRVHTHYAQAVAVTGRLSSNDPNLQNIPIRTPEGSARARGLCGACGLGDRQCRLFADRAAHHGPHQRRCGPARAFHDGLDVHRATAAEVFGVAVDQVSSEQRRYAKVINFGLIYGMSAFGLARNWASTTRRPRTTSSAILSATLASSLHGKHQNRLAKQPGLCGNRVWPAPAARRHQVRQGRTAGWAWSVLPSTRPCRARRPI
jgi:DNA polymerase-1